MENLSYLGEFEHLVLLALIRLGPEAYGVPIRELIEERAGREVSFGAVYSTLRRLAQKGYVSSSRGESTPVRGGKARRYFRPTDQGLHALQRSQQRLANMAEGIEVSPSKVKLDG